MKVYKEKTINGKKLRFSVKEITRVNGDVNYIMYVKKGNRFLNFYKPVFIKPRKTRIYKTPKYEYEYIFDNFHTVIIHKDLVDKVIQDYIEYYVEQKGKEVSKQWDDGIRCNNDIKIDNKMDNDKQPWEILVEQIGLNPNELNPHAKFIAIYAARCIDDKQTEINHLEQKVNNLNEKLNRLSNSDSHVNYAEQTIHVNLALSKRAYKNNPHDMMILTEHTQTQINKYI